MNNHNDTDSNKQIARKIDMSSEAIDRRLREAGELNQLGLSLAKAKPYPPPKEPRDPA
jgi:hypothetical protein